MNSSIITLSVLVAVLCPLQPPDESPKDSAGGIKVGDGVVQFVSEVDVPALSSGKLVTVAVEEFAPIEKDAIIAQLDDSILQDRLKVIELGRQLLLDKYQSEIEKKVADANLREAKIRHDANLSSQKSSPGSVAEMELGRSAIALTRAELESQRVFERKHELMLELKISEAELSKIQSDLQQLKIQSPVTGVVLKAAKQAGEWVNLGETIVTVARMDRLAVSIILSEKQLLHRSAVGTSVVVQWKEDERPLSLRGRIATVEPVLRNADTYKALVEIDNRQLSNGWLLTPGRRVQVIVYPQANGAESDSPATARLLNSPTWMHDGLLKR